MRVLLLGLLLLAAPAHACSLAYIEFDHGDLDGDVVVTRRGQEAVRIDLGSGIERSVTGDFFPTLAARDGIIYHQGQQGLGADCSGTQYFQALDARGDELQRWADVEQFDVDGRHVLVLASENVQVLEVGSWDVVHESTVSLGRQQMEEGWWDGLRPELALDADGERFAISKGDGTILVRSYGNVRGDAGGDTEIASFSTDRRPVMDWHDGRLVVGVETVQGDTSNFWIMDDLNPDHAQTVQLEVGDDWRDPGIAAGAFLILWHGDQVIQMDGESSRWLMVPDGLAVGAVVADEAGAAVLVREESEYYEGDAIGIQLLHEARPGTWYEPGALGFWRSATGPGFAWATDGPAVESSAPVDEHESPPMALPLLLLALLLVRRRG